MMQGDGFTSGFEMALLDFDVLSKHLLYACRKFLANLSATLHVHLTTGICAGSDVFNPTW